MSDTHDEDVVVPAEAVTGEPDPGEAAPDVLGDVGRELAREKRWDGLTREEVIARRRAGDRDGKIIRSAATAPASAPTGTGSGMVLSGLASRTGQPYRVMDQWGRYEETIMPGAFRSSLDESPDVSLLVEHSGLPLARTTTGTLTLDETTEGLTFRADLHPADPDAGALAAKVEHGVIDSASIGFYIRAEMWDDDLTQRHITGVDLDRGDVSAVVRPANPHTSVRIGDDDLGSRIGELVAEI